MEKGGTLSKEAYKGTKILYYSTDVARRERQFLLGEPGNTAWVVVVGEL